MLVTQSLSVSALLTNAQAVPLMQQASRWQAVRLAAQRTSARNMGCCAQVATPTRHTGCFKPVCTTSCCSRKAVPAFTAPPGRQQRRHMHWCLWWLSTRKEGQRQVEALAALLPRFCSWPQTPLCAIYCWSPNPPPQHVWLSCEADDRGQACLRGSCLVKSTIASQPQQSNMLLSKSVWWKL